MPLRDHFHPPWSIQRHWDSFLVQWSQKIIDQLHALLPPGYFAESHFDWPPDDEAQESATLVPLPATDFEVRVSHEDERPGLVAVIVLVSPPNKRPSGK